VDGKEIVSADSDSYGVGMAGILTGGLGKERNTALFDNLVVNSVGGSPVLPTLFPQDSAPLYP
jgi:hypothetical protein